MRHFARRRYILLFILILPIMAGCASQVQIWANSDSDDIYKFSTRSPHFIHIGETVKFNITITPDIGTYTILDFCGKRQFLERTKEGQYSFTYTFGEDWRDRSCTIFVRTYKQNGNRDFILKEDMLVPANTPQDQPDELLGEAAMNIVCYQSKIIIKFNTSDGSEPNWEEGKLYIYGPGDRKTLVTHGKEGKDGFTGIGPELGSGKYILFYEPKYWQVRRTGTTRVLFTIKDPNTLKPIEIEQFINTP